MPGKGKDTLAWKSERLSRARPQVGLGAIESEEIGGVYECHLGPRMVADVYEVIDDLAGFGVYECRVEACPMFLAVARGLTTEPFVWRRGRPTPPDGCARRFWSPRSGCADVQGLTAS